MVRYYIVASLNECGVIGWRNELALKCSKDLARFYRITTGVYPESSSTSQNTVIMGYNTWMSLPKDLRPLPKRMTVIVTRHHTIDDGPRVVGVSSMEDAFATCRTREGRIFVIGGSQIFNTCVTHFSTHCEGLYLTHFHNSLHSPKNMMDLSVFPQKLLEGAISFYREPIQETECEIQDFTTSSQRRVASQHVSYLKSTRHHGEIEYLRLLRKVLFEGPMRETRNSRVHSLFGERMVFDLRRGFPLLTTKKMGYKTILRELLWFISGSTSNRDLQAKRVHIWDQNASKEFLESRGLEYAEGDLGPIYGFQWRHAGATYVGSQAEYQGQGVDQLREIINLIKTDPHSRRIVMNAWNPPDLPKMALPPCHVMCQFYVNTEEHTLDCQMYQRSGDMFLGVPFNIASYAIPHSYYRQDSRGTPQVHLHISSEMPICTRRTSNRYIHS